MSKERGDQQRNTFPPSLRLRQGGEFDAVYAARMFRRCGPLTVHTLPDDRDELRLGLSVSRKVGKAVVRNRIKRLLREAFRLSQYDLPRGYDVVVSVRPHEPRSIDEYQQMLAETIGELDREWQRRRNT